MMATTTNTTTWMKRLALFTMVLTTLLCLGVQAADPCTSFTVTTRTSRKVNRGGHLTLTYRVKNNDDEAAGNSALAVSLPPGVLLKKAYASSMKPHNATKTTRFQAKKANSTSHIDYNLDYPNVVFWPYAPINAGKTRRFTIKLQVAKCATMPETLYFEARIMQIANDVLACHSPAPIAEVAVKTQRRYKEDPVDRKKQDNATSVCPLEYQLTKPGYKCAEAGDATSFLNRPTVESCYQFCYWYGGVPSPFYFNYYVHAGESQCICVGATCTPVPAEDYRIYQSYPNVPAPPLPTPNPGPYPQNVNDTVNTFDTNPILPAPGVWNNAYDSGNPNKRTQKVIDITDAAYVQQQTGISPIPDSLTNGPFDSAYLMQTTDSSSRAYTSIFFYPPNSAFNGLLFRDFVLEGMQGSYWFYLLSKKLQAPSYKIYTASVELGRTSIFVWTPSLNQASQGTYTWDEWVQHQFTENTGSTDAWPLGPTGGDGWWCSQNCYLPNPLPDGFVAGSSVRRSLRTYVEGWLSQPTDSSAHIGADTAVITGFQVTIGGGESDVTAFVKDFLVSTPRPNPIYNWEWTFATA